MTDINEQKFQSLISNDKMEDFQKITFFYVVLSQRKIEDQGNFCEVVWHGKKRKQKEGLHREKEGE